MGELAKLCENVGEGASDQLSADEQGRLIAEVRRHARGKALAQLCFDVLSRQAEEKSLFRGRRQTRVRASEHGLKRADCATPFGNVRTILERGPESGLEWSLLVALSVRGLDQALLEGAGEGRLVADKFVAQLDWLELATPYHPCRFLSVLLSPAHQDLLASSLLVALTNGLGHLTGIAARTVAALRVQVLGTLLGTVARSGLERLRAGDDLWLAMLASHALAEPVPSAPERLLLSGDVAHIAVGARRALRILTGWAFLSALARLVAYVLRGSERCTVELLETRLKVVREAMLLGRPRKRREQVYSLSDVRSAERVVAFPVAERVVGAACLVVAIGLGMVRLRDAVLFADLDAALFAGCAVLLGAGVDLLLSGLSTRRRASTFLSLFAGGRRVIALRGVDPDLAKRFVEQLAARSETWRG